MTVLERVVERTAIEGHDGRSGARIEKGVLDDGTPVVIKTASPMNDLTLVLSGGIDRERVLWESGAFDRLRGAIGHPILEVTIDGDLTTTVMRDLGDAIPGWNRVVTAAECERIARALGALHGEFLGDPPDSACTLEARLVLLSPASLRSLVPSENPLVDVVPQGWERFFELVDGDVAAAVASIHADPVPLADAMRRGPITLTHADLWLVNLAIEPDRVVLLDWAIATAGPPALDLAVFLTGTAAHMEPTREEFIAMFQAASPSADDDAVALAMLFGLTDMGWNKALDATGHDDPAMRARERLDLDWWVRRAAETLDRGLL